MIVKFEDTLATISEQYRKQQQDMHNNPNYGVASLTFAPIVAKIMKENYINSISDYGAGKKRLLEGLKRENIHDFDYFPYDPAFPEYGQPQQAELVCCIDVLEHIEPEFVENVIDELSQITKRIGFLSIHTGPAGKFLSDGRNAHLIQEKSSWWLPRLCKFFDVIHLQTHNYHGRGFWVLITPKR